MTKAEIELRDLKESLSDTPLIGSIVKCTKTLDQVNVKCVHVLLIEFVVTYVALKYHHNIVLYGL